MAGNGYFTPDTFAFLEDLAANNNREWFDRNKARYETAVKGPAVRFIGDFAPHLKKISAHFRADPRPVGGSLFRIYRDTRFSKDKSPYKTYVGIQFRHDKGKDVHAPGFYLHLQPGECFAGVGIWHPDADALRSIRDAIVEDPAGWKRAVNGKAFKDRLELTGDSLSRPPQGYDPQHPLIEDLKRKDFIAVVSYTESALKSTGFLEKLAQDCRAGSSMVKYLCGALGLAF